MTPPGISGNLTLVSCDLTCYRPYSSGAPTLGTSPQPKKRLNEETTHIATRHSTCVFVVVVSDHEHKDCIPSETALIWTNNSYQTNRLLWLAVKTNFYYGHTASMMWERRYSSGNLGRLLLFHYDPRKLDPIVTSFCHLLMTFQHICLSYVCPFDALRCEGWK